MSCHVDQLLDRERVDAERGSEHAAEILAWHLGDRILTPTVPDNEPEQLETAVVVLVAELHVIVVESDAERYGLLTVNPELKVGATVVVAGADRME